MRALRALGAQRWATRKLDAVEACVAKAAGPGSVRGAVQPGIAHSVVRATSILCVRGPDDCVHYQWTCSGLNAERVRVAVGAPTDKSLCSREPTQRLALSLSLLRRRAISIYL